MCLTEPPAISQLTEVNMTRPNVTWVKLNQLPNNTDFGFYVWATTIVGRGEVSVITESTLTVDCELFRTSIIISPSAGVSVCLSVCLSVLR